MSLLMRVKEESKKAGLKLSVQKTKIMVSGPITSRLIDGEKMNLNGHEFVNSINSLVLSFLYGPNLTSIHDYWKNHSLTIQTFVSKIMSLCFNMLSRLVIAFFLRSKSLLISWLQLPSTSWSPRK